jgi:hypothetical protein
MQTEINIKVGDKSPKEYFSKILEDIRVGKTHLVGIASEEDLLENLKENCIPKSIMDSEIGDYDTFLDERRKLMAKKMERYYKSL